MSLLNDDLNDSALFCKSLIQKRKASSNINPRNAKQLKLNFPLKTPKVNEIKEGLNDETAGEESQNGQENGTGPTSDYFQPKRKSNICPLCIKSFKTDSAYSNHMKQCAKSHKMTTQQLLDALELQKQQMQQRRDFGLPSQLVTTAKKTSSRKREEKERDSYDLALGLALSKSLSNHECKSEAITQTQKPTLQQFGITTNLSTEPCRRKNERMKKSILRTRTVEDRQKIIIEKLGVILLDEEQEAESSGPKPSSNLSFHSDQLTDFVDMAQRLWNLGENDEKLDWYVDGIKSHMQENEGNDKDNEKKSILPNRLKSEISKLQLSREKVYSSWKKMINNSEFSDVIGRTKDCLNYHLHTVVLFARFPEILKRDYESVFEKHSLSTILIFLEYLYCGTLDSLVEEEIQNLHNLAFEFNYIELIEILNHLENNLSKCCETSVTETGNNETEWKGPEDVINENKNEEFYERDLFAEENIVDLTQSSNESLPKENTSEADSYIEETYKSFLQREKEIEKLEEEEMKEARKSVESIHEVMQKILNGIEKENDVDLNKEQPAEKIQDQLRRESNDSTTMDFTEEFKMKNMNKSNECITLSSGSDSRESVTRDSLKKSPPNSSRTASPLDYYEVPYFDPYDNFHCFSEEKFSPVAVHSQSLITGNVSPGSVKSPDAVAATVTPKEAISVSQEEPKKNSEYCSTPVTIRPSLKIKSSTKSQSGRSRKRRSDLSASRILRKSLGLEIKTKNKRSSTFQRKSIRKKEDIKRKDFAELLTDSILNELSKSATLMSSTPVRMTNFVEVTPVLSREELKDSVTPLPNYSNMEENLLKEQLAKYGLKKNLAKSKAKKILRHIYEELHPLYNTETGKIVKILDSDSPGGKKKTKSKGKPNKNAKPPKKTDSRSKKNKGKEVNSSEESDGSTETLEGEQFTSGSDLENLSETLTQSAPSNPVDLPSAFVEYLENNPEYHRKILLYEPIWIEELQKKLKESFKKHFKISDLMDYLDQQCITFRSATQVKNSKKQLEKKKLGKKSLPDI